MPIDLGLGSLVTTLNRFLSYFQNERHFREGVRADERENRKEAFEAILSALVNTRKYVEGLPDGFDREEEFRLAELWGIAEIKCSHAIEMERPAREAADKVAHWTSRLKMPQDMLIEKGIDLETVESNYRELLRNL